MSKTISTIPRNKLSEIDFMRAVCCILVVIIHVTAAFWYTFKTGSPSFKAIIILNSLSKFAVPSFVLISGFVLYYVYNNKKIEPLTFYKKRMMKVVVPYLIWSVLYIAVNYLAYERPIDINSLLYYFGLGKANYHLYYICLILQLYLIFPLLIKIFQSTENRFIITIGFFILNFAFINYVKKPFSDRIFIYYIMFFILGFYLADLKIKGIQIKKSIALIVSGLYLVFTSYYVFETYNVMAKLPLLSKEIYRHGWWYFSIISTLFLYILANYFNLSSKKIVDNTFINSISKHSFMIYLSHPMFMKILHSLPLYKEMQGSLPTVLFILEFVIILISSWTFSILLEKSISSFKSFKKIPT